MMQSMLLMLVLILSIIGTYTITKEIVFPIADMVLYATGYTIFNMWIIDPKKVYGRLFKLTKYVVRCFFEGIGIWASSPGETDDVLSGNKHWKPYFHYWKE